MELSKVDVDTLRNQLVLIVLANSVVCQKLHEKLVTIVRVRLSDLTSSLAMGLVSFSILADVLRMSMPS